MKIHRLVYDAVLSAMCAVLGAVSLDFGVIKLTLENFPVLLGALLFGPVDGMLIGGIGTFLYQLLRYGLEASTPLWILPYMLSGFAAGLWAKKLRENTGTRKLIPLLLVNGFLVTMCNTGSLYIVYRFIWKMPVEAMLLKLPLRMVVSAAKSIVFAFILPPLLCALRKIMSRSEGIQKRLCP